jgi:hypothetical protein
LLAPLQLDRAVKVTSDQAHATDVQSKLPASVPGKPSKGTLTGVPEVDGWQHISPAEVLLELAMASTPALLPPGMRDLSLRWAWLHYCWAFDAVAPPPPIEKMLLSSAARDLAQHRKQVASDDLGVGFGLILARRALEARFAPAITAVFDAEAIIETPGALSAWGIQHTGPLRPDYFIQVSNPPGDKRRRSSVWVIECKGTQGTGHLQQIRKGVTQTATITDISTGKNPPAIISATAFSKSQTRIRLVDPPGDNDDPWAGTEANDSQDSANVRREMRQEVAGLNVFRHDLARLDLSTTLAFAGLYSRAAELLPDRLRRETRERDGLADAPAIQAGRDGRASGVRAELPLIGGRTLRATCAVDRRVLDAANKGSVSDVHAAREQVTEELAARTQTELGERQSMVEMASPDLLRVTARTGLVLELTVS